MNWIRVNPTEEKLKWNIMELKKEIRNFKHPIINDSECEESLNLAYEIINRIECTLKLIEELK